MAGVIVMRVRAGTAMFSFLLVIAVSVSAWAVPMLVHGFEDKAIDIGRPARQTRSPGVRRPPGLIFHPPAALTIIRSAIIPIAHETLGRHSRLQ